MQNYPVISVVAPIYGVEQYITRFAESLLSQSYPRVQFIFVNDGTKDGSISILNKIIDEKYSHLRSQILIIDKENGGLPAARKTGLEYATGDYIYHVDSDDWIAEGALEKIAAKIAESECDILHFGFVKEYASRRSFKHPKHYTAATKFDFVCDMYNHKAAASVWSKCIKRSLYEEHTIYSPRYSHAEDCYVTTQLVGYAQSIDTLDEVLYHYRKDNPNAMTRNALRKRKREYALNFIDLYEKYRNVPLDENPIACIFDYIIMQAGWYSIFYRLGLFEEFPYLAKEVRKAKIHIGTDVPIVSQLFTKLVALFK